MVVSWRDWGFHVDSPMTDLMHIAARSAVFSSFLVGAEGNDGEPYFEKIH